MQRLNRIPPQNLVLLVPHPQHHWCFLTIEIILHLGTFSSRLISMIMPAHASNCPLLFLYIKSSFVCFITLFINLEINKTFNSPPKLQIQRNRKSLNSHLEAFTIRTMVNSRHTNQSSRQIQSFHIRCECLCQGTLIQLQQLCKLFKIFSVFNCPQLFPSIALQHHEGQPSARAAVVVVVDVAGVRLVGDVDRHDVLGPAAVPSEGHLRVLVAPPLDDPSNEPVDVLDVGHAGLDVLFLLFNCNLSCFKPCTHIAYHLG